MIGAGANRKMTGRMLNQFIEKTGIPFVTTQMGKGVIDERHPLFLGCAALSAGDFCHRAIEDADCIINVGHDVIEKPPFFMKSERRHRNPCLTRTAEVDPVYFPQIEVIGDIANAIWQIKEDIVEQGRWKLRSHAGISQGGAGAHANRSRKDDSLPDLPAAPGRSRCATPCPRTAIICLDNGVYKIWFARGYHGLSAEHRPARQCARDHGRGPAVAR